MKNGLMIISFIAYVVCMWIVTFLFACWFVENMPSTGDKTADEMAALFFGLIFSTVWPITILFLIYRWLKHDKF